MSGPRQLFGIDFPTTTMLGTDVNSVLSAQPISVSPGGTEALLAVRINLSDGNQVDRHIFLDLTSGLYGNMIETVLGEGDASTVVVKAVDVIWGNGTNPQVLASYADLTDPIYADASSSDWTYEFVGLVDSQNIISRDLIEDATGRIGDGSVTRIVADKAGGYFAFESLAGNYFDSSDVANYDENGTKDIYVLGTDGTGLQRASVVPGAPHPSEDVHLLDYRRLEGEDQVLFESLEGQWASFTADTNGLPDLFLYRSAAADPIEIVSRVDDGADGEAVGFVSGQALFGEVLGHSGVVYVTDSGAMSSLDSEDPPQPDLVVFDVTDNSTTRIDPALTGLVKGPGFGINLQGSTAGELFVTVTNASIGDEPPWSDNAQLVSISSSGARLLSLTSSEVLGQPAGALAEGSIESAVITESGDALINSGSVLLNMDAGYSSPGQGILLSAANNHSVTAPIDIDPATNGVSEAAAADTVVGLTASASDDDTYAATVTYSLFDNAGGRFQIDPATGEVSVLDPSLLDYESQTSHDVVVRATSADGSTSDTTFTIELTDTNEFPVGTPVDTNTAPNEVSENAAIGASVGISAEANDLDGTDTVVSYSLIEDAGGRFQIDPTTGEVSVLDPSLLDYESQTSHDVTIEATSADGSTSQTTVTINLSDDTSEFVVGGATDSDAADNSVSESATTDQTVGLSALASDADGSDTVTYSLFDNAGGRFQIDPATGEVSVLDPSLLDYESQTSHDVVVRATSADGSTSDTTFTIELTDTNEFPVGTPVDTNTAPNEVSENAAIGASVGISAEANDLDGTDTVVSYSLIEDAGGRFQIDPTTGEVSVLDPSLLDYESQTSHDVTIEATSADGSTSQTTVTIAVVENMAPSGSPAASLADGVEDNSYQVTEEQLLEGFSDPDNGTLSVANLGSSTGSVSPAVEGVYTITPGPDDFGTVILSYDVLDGQGGSSPAQIQFTLEGVNDAPVVSAVDESAGTEENTSLTGQLATATDVDGTVTYQLVTDVASGTLSLAGDGSYSFDPGTDFDDLAAGATREVSFSYQVVDDLGAESAEKGVTLTVTGSNDAPVVSAVDESAGTEENTSLTGQLATATDVDGTVTYQLVTDVASGTLSLAGDGSYSFDPGTDFDDLAAGATREVSFSYQVVDDLGAESAEKGVTLTVTGSNDAPVVSAVDESAGTEENTSLTGQLATATDVDGTVTYQLVTDVASGTLSLAGDGSYSFDPGTDFDDLAAGATREVSFSYQVVDDLGAESAEKGVTLTVTGSNDAPVVSAVDESAGTEENTSLTGQLATATDVDGTVTYQLVTDVASGTLSLAGDGSYSFDPGTDFDDLAAGATREVSFSYQVVDDLGAESAEKGVTLTVTGSNDAPVVSAVDESAGTEENTSLTGQLATATDVDGTVTYQLVTDVASGTLSLAGDGSYSFDPGTDFDDLAAGATREVSFSYQVVDDLGAESAEKGVTLTVTGSNDAPVAVDDIFTVATNSPSVAIDVLANDTDLDGEVAISAVASDQGGTVSVVDGVVSYEPPADFLGTEIITYTIVDETGASSQASVTVSVVPNQSPVFEVGSSYYQFSENIDTTVVIHTAQASDPDGDDVTYSLGGRDADEFSVDELSGAVSFVASPDYESKSRYEFSVLASDSTLTAVQDLTVEINNVVELYTLDADDLAAGGVFAGEALDDFMDGRGASESLELSGGGGVDVLYGGDADDVIDGGDGDDQLSGGSGNDILVAGGGANRVDGGDGVDTLVLETAPEDVRVLDLSREWNYSGDGWNQILNVENFVLGDGVDLVRADDSSNTIAAGAGNDWVHGNGGDDILLGGEGTDRLFGGDGNDTVLYQTDEDLVIDLNSEWQLGNGDTSEGYDKLIDIENVTTGSGDDVLVGDGGDNILTGGDGDDTMTGGGGADVFRFYSSEGPSTDVITDFTVGEDSIEFIDDTTGEVVQAQITTDASGSTVTWDELTIVLDVTVDYDDINPIV